nr:NAD-dependent dihydropyrimidine dehydrogenase subunit PreA [Chlamydiota bacterium]
MPKTLTHVAPIYDICKTYLENAIEGPFFKEPIPERKWQDPDQWMDFLGHQVASPLGIPAGPLLNSKWTTLAARLGFDILTYKTIRSYEHPAHPLPNVIFVETEGALTHDRMGQFVKPLNHEPLTPEELAITNSFGNPSRTTEYLQIDIHLAVHALEKGQVLIVSVFGTGSNLQELKKDFIKTALLAKESGAPIVEANFSCPNVSAGGTLYHDPEMCYELAKALVDALGDTPLIIKMGVFTAYDNMEQVIQSLARAGVRAICGINTVPMKVIDDNEEPVLGEDRLQSGICGSPIRPLALEFVHDAHTIIRQHSLDLEVLGCGGITSPEHFDTFLKYGAKAALTATGMMWDPYLAHKWH